MDGQPNFLVSCYASNNLFNPFADCVATHCRSAGRPAKQITNYLTASEELKSKAEEAERAYTQALNDARSEASRLLDASKAEMKKELQAAINKADAEISVKVGESEKSIAEIRKNAMASIEKVAKDTAKEIVVALGAKADAKTINAAVSSKMKG